MKKTILFFLFSIIIISTFYFIACTKNKTTQASSFEPSKIYKLEEPGQIDDEIYLPKGTQWQYTSSNGNEVKFLLPKGYTFLIKNTKTGIAKLSPAGGSYTCTCSGTGGSCTVFYNKQVGYGCLQNNCTGSCTGTPHVTIAEKIVGVLAENNTSLDFTSQFPTASLSTEGKETLLLLPEVQNLIKDYYNVLYKNVIKPDFESISINNLPNKMKLLKAQIYGFSFGMLVTSEVRKHIKENVSKELNDNPIAGLAILNEATSKNIESFVNAVANLETADSPTCSCSGGTKGGNCTLQSKGALGYKAYYCNGCTSCTLSGVN